ncbi:MAG: ADP-ribosylglycohydrolase family protein [Chloroflexota bacterium]
MNNIAWQRIMGSLWGGAIGDALGGPAEPFGPELVLQKFGGRITTLVDYVDEGPDWYPVGCPKGTYTDDTILRNVLCQAIVRQRGRVDARQFAAEYLGAFSPEHFTRPGIQLWLGEAVVYYKLLACERIDSSILFKPHAREIGQDNLPACDAAMMIGPVGLINAGDPHQAYLDALEVGSVIQSGASLAAAAAVAAAVAEAMRVRATPNSILDATLRELEGEVSERVEKAIWLASTCGSPEEFKRGFHEEMLTKVADALEVVPAAFGILRVTDCAVVPAMLQGANFGRDCDTIATIAGSIAGAYEGADAIPEEWKDAVRAANPDQPSIEQLGAGLHDALIAEEERCAARLGFLQSILGAK